MTKFKSLSAVCLVAALAAAASPALARGGHRGGGYGPGIAAGIVAGAVLGGAAYNYGPRYYGDSYAYDNSDYGNTGYYDSGPAYYSAPAPVYRGYNPDPNGFVCQPGTVFRNENGRTTLCQ